MAALRDAMVEMGGNPEKVNPQVPVDLVIDHSVQVDVSGAHANAPKISGCLSLARRHRSASVTDAHN